MDLKDFVSTTLLDIFQGVKDAQTRLSQERTGGQINPGSPSGEGQLETVHFDVAVVANEGTQTNAKAGVSVVPFLQLAAGGASSQSTASTSRIQFKVDVRYPTAGGRV